MLVAEAIRVNEQVSERLSWKQICERYPDAWVVLVDTQWVNDTDFEFGTVIVLGHFKSRKEDSPHIKAVFQHYHEVGSFWTGGNRSQIPRFVFNEVTRFDPDRDLIFFAGTSWSSR